MTDVLDPLVRTLLLRFLCSIDQVGASTSKVYLYTKMAKDGHKYDPVPVLAIHGFDSYSFLPKYFFLQRRTNNGYNCTKKSISSFSSAAPSFYFCCQACPIQEEGAFSTFAIQFAISLRSKWKNSKHNHQPPLVLVEWSSFHQFSHLMVRPSAPISIKASS